MIPNATVISFHHEDVIFGGSRSSTSSVGLSTSICIEKNYWSTTTITFTEFMVGHDRFRWREATNYA